MEAEKIRKQKERDEAHKQKVLEKIRREKGEKKAAAAASAGGSASESGSKQSKTVDEETECVVMVRYKGGQQQWTGRAGTKLWDIAQWAMRECVKQPFTASTALCTMMPRVRYQGDQLKSHNCMDLGIAPRGVLVLEF